MKNNKGSNTENNITNNKRSNIENNTEVIKFENLKVAFPVQGGRVEAVDNVSLELKSGAMTVVVGESGCGKSVLGEAFLGILPAYAEVSGAVWQNENNLVHIPAWERKNFSLIPQSPGSAFSPMRNIRKHMEDALLAAGREDKDDSIKKQYLLSFGLEDTDRVLSSYAFELSGGMLQRVLCAMSLCNSPKWILADEPTKGLDEKVLQTVYGNLQKLKDDYDCSMLIITHDIELAKNYADYTAVMYAGQVLEYGEDVLKNPLHPYTEAFIKAGAEYGFQVIAGKAPTPFDRPSGCKFAPRCPYAEQRCMTEEPKNYMIEGRAVRCFRYE